MKKWIIILPMHLATSLLLLSSFVCTQGRDEVDGRARKAFDKIGKAGQVFCSTTPRPNQMVLMFFQPFHDNISSVELADCSEVKIEALQKIHTLDSVPIIPERPQIQLSFYNWQGIITPTKLNDTMATFCTLTSYEAAIAKGDKSTRKTRAAILCSLSEHSQQVIPETVPLSIYMSQYIYETIEEIVKLISLYQWGTSSSTYKISGLDIITLNLTSHGHPKQSIRIRGQFQMAAILSFSTSLIKHFRSLTEAVLESSANLSHNESEPVPYNLKGFIMVVKAKSNELNKFWWFLSPFTPSMWLTIVALTVFSGFV